MELIRVQDSDYRKTYELYMTFPENENGYMNSVYGYNYEQFLEWIEKKRNWSLGKGAAGRICSGYYIRAC